MGIKAVSLRKKIIFICLFVLMIFFTGKTFALEKTVNKNIPQKFVKVGISDNNFKSLVYNQVGIIASAEFYLYDKQSKKQIAKFSPEDIVKVKYNCSKFEISVNNKVIVSNLEGTLVFDSKWGFLGVENLKRKNVQALYHGVLELTPKNENQFYIVNILDIQDYLKGVVPNEIPVNFGLEALKAQAIAARNYVLMPRTRAYKEFDLDDSVASQVYFGVNTESPLSNQAVEQTEGLVALHNWDLILAQYCSTAGGYTESYENTFSDNKTKLFPSHPKPYLKGSSDIIGVNPLDNEEKARKFYMSTPDSYDMKSPYYRWQKEFDIKELQGILNSTLPVQSKTGFIKPAFGQGEDLGDIKDIKVIKRGVSGKVIELEIITDKGKWKVSKELVIRRVFQKNGVNLPSANIVFDYVCNENKSPEKITIYGGGFGHGVGMSQYGAGFMSVHLHKTFDEILQRYYQDIIIATEPIIISSNEGQKTAQVQFFAPEKKALLIIDNKYKIKEFSVNINGKDVNIELSKNGIFSDRINRFDISNYINKGKNILKFYFPEGESQKALRLYVELIGKREQF